MLCVKCGIPLSGDEEFCPNCGIRLCDISLIPDRVKPSDVYEGGEAHRPQVGLTGEAPVSSPRIGDSKEIKRKTNGWAIASLIFGIGAFTFVPIFGAIFAITFALIARRDIERSDGLQGGGYCAVAGLTLGVLGILLPSALLVLFLAWGVVFRDHGGAAKDNLIGAVEVARIYYLQNNNSFSGMRAKDLLEIDESLDIRDAPGRSPEVVYIDEASKNIARLYCYSRKGKKYVAAADGDRWRFKFGSHGESGKEWLQDLWHDLNPMD